MKKRIFFLLLGLIAFCVLISGCGYRLGSILPTRIQTVYIVPFTNKTSSPGLDYTLTESLKRQFRTDGTLRVVASEAEADAVVSGQIHRFSREAVVLSTDNTTKEYVIYIYARYSFKELNGPLAFENLETSGSTSFYVGSVPEEKIDSTRKGRGTHEIISASTLPEAEKNAIPLATDALGQNIVSQVVEQGNW